MSYLLIVSCIWAFSFGLIKTQLTGLHPSFIAWARIAIAFPIFLPFLRFKNLTPSLCFKLLGIGAIQYGLLYIVLLCAFQFLDGYQVALFTIFSPIYVTLLYDFFERQFSPVPLLCALLAVIGSGIINYKQGKLDNVLIGFGIVQLANICFDFGQVSYKRLRMKHKEIQDHQVYAILYAGALLVTSAFLLWNQSWQDIKILSKDQFFALLYLGAIASGIGFFWWNKGAVKTKPGTLAVFNNLKIPLAVLVSITIFGESVNLYRLIIGGGIMAIAIFLSEKYGTKHQLLKKSV